TKNSLSAIVDANITTMIAAVVLFIFGTSSVQGFATMLIVSILVSFLTAVFGTRLLLGLWVKSRFLNKRKSWFAVKKEDIQDISEKKEPEAKVFNKQPNIVKHRKKFIYATLILVVIGTASLVMFQLNPGIDFTSGSRIEILAEESLDAAEVENALAELELEAESIVLSGENKKGAAARFDTVLSESKIAEVTEYFIEEYGNEPSVGVVSPIVGEELVKNAIYAVA